MKEEFENKYSEEQREEVTNGYTWWPEIEYTDFCDHNGLPTYSYDVRHEFEAIKSRYNKLQKQEANA